MFKRILLLSFLLLIPAFLFAKPVQLVFTGLSGLEGVADMTGIDGIVSNSNIPFELDWDESWFGAASSTLYNHKLARAACFFSNIAYSEVEKDVRNNALVTDYHRLGFADEDIELHYNLNYKDAMWGDDQCAYSIASKKISSAAGERTLIMVIIRGTTKNVNEWLSNLNIGKVSEDQLALHRGFASATASIHTALISYMLRHKIDPTDSYLFVTGHSRGAAVANLLSVLVLGDNFFHRENIYTYTFACPNVTTDSDAGSDIYNFIWNIVNAEDIVPTVPLYRNKWNFRKYGRTRTLVNAVNTDIKLYNDVYIPRINSYFEQLSGRKYYPFTLGPYVPICLTMLLSSMNESAQKFYKTINGLHGKTVLFLRGLFAVDSAYEQAPEKTRDSIGLWLVRRLLQVSGDLVNYLTLAFVDMHSDNTYLSYLMALDENEAFSDVGYSTILVKGTEELGIFDQRGNLLLRIIDGSIQYKSITMPIIALPSLSGNVVIGFPSTVAYDVVFTDETILPSPSKVMIEHFDAAGVYLGTCEPQRLWPHWGKVYQFKIGSSILDKNKISPVKLSMAEGKSLVKTASLKPQTAFRISPEIFLDSDLDLGGGLRVGNQLIFASFLFSHGLTRVGKNWEFAAGIGNELSLFKGLKWDTELFGRFVFVNMDKEDKDDRKHNFIPAARLSLSYNLIGRLKFFVAGAGDLKIMDFNDFAFDDDVRDRNIPSYKINGKYSIVPTVQIGFRF